MKKTSTRNHLLIHILLIAGIAVTVFPFLWMVFTSFKTLPESMQIPPSILPEHWQLDSYKYVLEILPFGKVYINTIVVTIITVLVQVAFCTMAAYGFARIDFPFKNAILPGLFLPNLFSAFGTFLLRQFFMSLPKELEEAALLDGCNRFQIFGKIMLPLVQPGIVALVIFTAKFAWNDFMWPLIVNTDPAKMTLAPALSTLKGQYATNYPAQMAGAVMAVIPMIVLFFIFQKQFIEGVAQSGIKG